jgi:hypothetical protein
MKTIIILGLLVLLALVLSRPPANAQSPGFPVGEGFYPTGNVYIPIQVDANGVVQTTT